VTLVSVGAIAVELADHSLNDVVQVSPGNSSPRSQVATSSSISIPGAVGLAFTFCAELVESLAANRPLGFIADVDLRHSPHASACRR
jgi:hypothetical protein